MKHFAASSPQMKPQVPTKASPPNRGEQHEGRRINSKWHKDRPQNVVDGRNHDHADRQ